MPSFNIILCVNKNFFTYICTIKLKRFVKKS